MIAFRLHTSGFDKVIRQKFIIVFSFTLLLHERWIETLSNLFDYMTTHKNYIEFTSMLQGLQKCIA